MRPADDALPIAGSGATKLGVRVPKDIAPNADGEVAPSTGGMSVAPTLGTLPLSLVPARLAHLVPGAYGNNKDRVWMMGDGPFVSGPVAPKLDLNVDRLDHANVEPDATMPLGDYVGALEATRSAWSNAH